MAESPICSQSFQITYINKIKKGKPSEKDLPLLKK